MRSEEGCYALIEVIDVFKMKTVACVLIEIEFAVGKGGMNFVCHPLGREDVIFSSNDEGRASEARKIGEDIVIDTSGSLAGQSLNALAFVIRGGVFGALATLEKAGVFATIIPSAFVEDEELDVLHECAGGKVAIAGE